MHIIYIYTRYTETSAVASDPHNGETKTINTIQAKTLLRFVISRCMYFVIFSAIGPTCTFIILSVGIAGAGGGVRGFNPPVNVFNSPSCASLPVLGGQKITPTDHNYRHWLQTLFIGSCVCQLVCTVFFTCNISSLQLSLSVESVYALLCYFAI